MIERIFHVLRKLFGTEVLSPGSSWEPETSTPGGGETEERETMTPHTGETEKAEAASVHEAESNLPIGSTANNAGPTADSTDAAEAAQRAPEDAGAVSMAAVVSGGLSDTIQGIEPETELRAAAETMTGTSSEEGETAARPPATMEPEPMTPEEPTAAEQTTAAADEGAADYGEPKPDAVEFWRREMLRRLKRTRIV